MLKSKDMATKKTETKSAKEVAAPKKVDSSDHKLLRDYGKRKAGEKITLGPNGVKQLRGLKYIK